MVALIPIPTDGILSEGQQQPSQPPGPIIVPDAYRRLLESLMSWVGEARVSTGASPLVGVERVNSYFRLKAAEVFNDEASVRLLARLYESHSLPYPDLPVDDINGVALARLTAAGFCEVGPLRARITDDGQRFIDSIHQE